MGEGSSKRNIRILNFKKYANVTVKILHLYNSVILDNIYVYKGEIKIFWKLLKFFTQVYFVFLDGSTVLTLT